MNTYALSDCSEYQSCFNHVISEVSRGKRRTPLERCPSFSLISKTTYFIARESAENYTGKFSKNKPAGSITPVSTLSDSALLSGLERLRGKERKVQLDILLYIRELEKRRLYLPRGYNSLFEFCTRHLGYSRAGAYRRIQASKCIERFPKIAELLLTGKLNISLVSLISGVLTEENIDDILARVSSKSYRDAEIAIVMYKPIETVTRDKVKPVCVLKKKISNNTKSSLNVGTKPEAQNSESSLNVETNPGAQNPEICLNVETNRRNCRNINKSENSNSQNPETNASEGAAKEEVELKQKFKLEFTVDPEFMRKLERIKSLLSGKYPEGVNFEMLFNIVMDEYLNRRSPEKRLERRAKREANKQKEAKNSGRETKKLNKPVTNKLTNTCKQRSRNIPAAVRDKVYKRDGGRCTFVGKNGKRCDSTWNLEIDHIVPFAKGGDNSPGNLRLLCAKHNLLEAQCAYGEHFMKRYVKRE